MLRSHRTLHRKVSGWLECAMCIVPVRARDDKIMKMKIDAHGTQITPAEIFICSLRHVMHHAIRTGERLPPLQSKVMVAAETAINGNARRWIECWTGCDFNLANRRWTEAINQTMKWTNDSTTIHTAIIQFPLFDSLGSQFPRRENNNQTDSRQLWPETKWWMSHIEVKRVIFHWERVTGDSKNEPDDFVGNCKKMLNLLVFLVCIHNQCKLWN